MGGSTSIGSGCWPGRAPCWRRRGRWRYPCLCVSVVRRADEFRSVCVVRRVAEGRRRCVCLVATPEWLAGLSRVVELQLKKQQQQQHHHCQQPRPRATPKIRPAVHACTTRPVCLPDISPIPENGFIVLIAHRRTPCLRHPRHTGGEPLPTCRNKTTMIVC